MTKRAAVSLCLVLVSLVTALVGAGCGASNALDPVATAATTSNAAPGYRMTFLMNVTSSVLPQPIVATGGGTFDARDHAAQFNLNMAIPAMLGGSGGSFNMAMIMRDGAMYIRMPSMLSSKLPGGRPWMKIEISKMAKSMGMPGLSSMLNGAGMTDPSQFLQYLRGESGNVTKVGTDTVDGVSTTHYRATVDMAKAIKRLSGNDSAAAQRLEQTMMNDLHTHVLPMDVWIDSNHLVRRIALHMSFTVPTTTQSLAMSMQFDIPEYGPQSEPQAPPAGQVTDMSSMLGNRSGSGTTSGSLLG
jgi:hypothetical protein